MDSERNIGAREVLRLPGYNPINYFMDLYPREVLEFRSEVRSRAVARNGEPGNGVTCQTAFGVCQKQAAQKQ